MSVFAWTYISYKADESLMEQHFSGTVVYFQQENQTDQGDI